MKGAETGSIVSRGPCLCRKLRRRCRRPHLKTLACCEWLLCLVLAVLPTEKSVLARSSPVMPPKRRLNHCYAPGCKTGYARTGHNRKLSLFKAPADEERRLVWQRNLHRSDKALDVDCAVCELHFESRFIIRDYVHIVNGAELRIPRGSPTLSPMRCRQSCRTCPTT